MKKKLLSAVLAAAMIFASVPSALAAKKTGSTALGSDICSTWGSFDTEEQVNYGYVVGSGSASLTTGKSGGGFLADIKGGSWVGARFNASLAVGETYDISFDVKCDVQDKGICLIWYYSSGSYDKTLLSKTIKTTSGWAHYSNTWTCDGTSAKGTEDSGSGQFEIRYGSGQETGTIVIDNFKIVPHGNVPDADYSSMQLSNAGKAPKIVDSIADEAPIVTGAVYFSDMENHWAEDTVTTLAQYGYINGMGDNAYAPDSEVTRAQFVKMMTDTFGLRDPENTKTSLTDVNDGAWYAPSVKIAESLGLISPALTFGDKFFPDKAITREEAAFVAVKTAAAKNGKKQNDAVTFTDDGEISEWVKNEVHEASEYGLIRGYGDGTFAPQGTLTRAEAAQVLKNVAELFTRFAIYVDAQNGKDLNDGTAEAPLKTLQKATETVRKYNQNMTNDIYVYLKGEFAVSSTWSLTNADSGMNGYRVIYTSWGDEKPLLTAGTEHSGFTLYDAEKNIYSIDVGTDRVVRQAYFNGVRGIQARTVGGLRDAEVSMSEAYYTCSNTEFLSYRHPELIEMNIKANWRHSRVRMGTLTDLGDGRIKITPNKTVATAMFSQMINGNVKDHRRFPVYLENAWEFLDEPGEWYYEPDDGKIYYIPREGEDMSSMELIVPKGEEILKVAGGNTDSPVMRVAFNNLQFSYTNSNKIANDGGWAGNQSGTYADKSMNYAEFAVNVEHAAYVTFTNNKFAHTTSGAIMTQKSIHHCDIIGNEFYDIGNTAIQLGGHNDTQDITDAKALNDYNRVENNYIHQIGQEHMSGVGVSSKWIRYTTINHNEIVNTPYAGMQIGWGWGGKTGAGGYPFHANEIGYNYFHEILVDRLYDGAGIYTLGASSESESDVRSTLHDNYFQNMRNGYGAIYPDEGSSDWDIYNNVIDDTEVEYWRFNWGDLGVWDKTKQYWLHIWTDTIRRITATNNYTTTKGYRNNGLAGTIEVEDNPYYPDAEWPEEALEIIEASGIEESYKSNYPTLNEPQALTNGDDTEYTITKQSPVDLGLKVVGRFDSEYPLEDFNVQYWVENPDILEVSEDGIATALGTGITYVMANAVVDGVPQIKTFKINCDGGYEKLESDVSAVTMLKGFSQTLKVNAVTGIGNKTTVPGENITYEVADESVATVDENGLATAHKIGETTVKIKATYLDLYEEIELPIYVISYTNDDSDSLPFDKAPNTLFNGSWTGKATVSGDSVTVNGSPAYNLSTTLGSGLYAFDLTINDPGTWPSLALRCSERMGTYADSDCYLIGFKDSFVEFQRFNGGVRTMIFGEDMYNPVGGAGIPNLPESPLYEYGKRFSVITGVIDTNEGPRIVLFINGKCVFDYVDKNTKALRNDGLFGIYESTGNFVFSPYTGITE